MRGAEWFGPSFQRQLVRATLDDPGLRALVKRFIDAGQLGWTDPTSLWAWQVIAAHDHPTMLQMEVEYQRLGDEDPARAGAQAVLIPATDWRDHDYVRKQIIEWARQQTFQLGFEEAREAWNQGDHEEARTRMMGRIEEMDQIRLDVADRGWFFEEFADRQQRRIVVADGGDYFPCGVDKIDRAMNGGLHYGELEIPLAYSGIGKTFYCIQRGFIATRMRRRVLHLVLEGGRIKTEDRYEARFASTIYRSVRRGDIETETMALMHREYRLLRHNLVLRGFSDRTQWQITYEDLLGELDTLRREHGWVPELIIVDYGDLVWAPGDTETARQKIAFRQLKTLAERTEFPGHRGYAVSAPSQAQRPDKGADEREHVLKPRDAADAYEKMRTADAAVSINRTNQEKEHGLARVFLGKYRDDEDGVLVRVKTDYPNGGFSKLGLPEPPPPPPNPNVKKRRGR